MTTVMGMRPRRLGVQVLAVLSVFAAAACGGTDDRDPHDRATPDAAWSYCNPVQHDGEISGDDFTALLTSTKSLVEHGSTGTPPAGVLHRCAKFDVVSYDASGTPRADGTMAYGVLGGGTTLCYVDFEKRVSMALLYDANPRWNGSNAAVFFYPGTRCHNEKSRGVKTAALYMDRAPAGDDIDYSAPAGDDLESTSTELTPLQKELAGLLDSTRFGPEVIAAHWMG